MKNFRVFVIMAVLFILTACTADEITNTNDALTKLTSMKSYVASAEITYYSDKSTTVYSGIHYAQDNGKYCIEVIKPTENAGDKVLYDGKMIWQYSKKNNDKISASIPDRPERQQLILFEFIKNVLNSEETKKEEDDNCTIFSVQMPKLHKYMSVEKLWVNKETLLPEKLVIYDEENKERVIVAFSDFKYNEDINDKIFTLQTEGDKNAGISESNG